MFRLSSFGRGFDSRRLHFLTGDPRDLFGSRGVAVSVAYGEYASLLGPLADRASALTVVHSVRPDEASLAALGE